MHFSLLLHPWKNGREPSPFKGLWPWCFWIHCIWFVWSRRKLKETDYKTSKRCDRISIGCHSHNCLSPQNNASKSTVTAAEFANHLSQCFLHPQRKHTQQAMCACSSLLSAVLSTEHRVTFTLPLAAETGGNNATNSLPASINPRMHFVIKHTSHQRYHISIKHRIKSPINTRAVRTR